MRIWGSGSWFRAWGGVRKRPPPPPPSQPPAKGAPENILDYFGRRFSGLPLRVEVWRPDELRTQRNEGLRFEPKTLNPLPEMCRRAASAPSITSALSLILGWRVRSFAVRAGLVFRVCSV